MVAGCPPHHCLHHPPNPAACVVRPAGEEPVAQRRRALGRAAAVLRHQGVQLLHSAVRGVTGHGRAEPGARW